MNEPQVEPATSRITPLYRAWLILRSSVFWVWQILSTLVIGPFAVLFGLFSYRVGYWTAMLWIRSNVWGLRLICGVSWKVDGLENVPDQPCIVMSKHQSTWDAYFLPMTFYPAVYVAKRSLMYIPIFGWAIWVLKFIMIDRASGRSAVRQMVEQAKDRLARGRWILIFPEGTRRAVGAEPDYKIGGALVAKQTNTPVLPVAANAGEFWPRMGFIKWPGVITVIIGPLVSVEGKKSDQILAETQAWIESRMSEIVVPNRFPY